MAPRRRSPKKKKSSRTSKSNKSPRKKSPRRTRLFRAAGASAGASAASNQAKKASMENMPMDLKKKIGRWTIECKEMPLSQVAIASQMSDGAEIESYSGPQHQVHIRYRYVDLSSGVSYVVKQEDISEDIFTWIQANPSQIEDPQFDAPHQSVQRVRRNVGIPVKGSADHPPFTVWVRMILQKVETYPLDSLDSMFRCQHGYGMSTRFTIVNRNRNDTNDPTLCILIFFLIFSNQSMAPRRRSPKKKKSSRTSKSSRRQVSFCN